MNTPKTPLSSGYIAYEPATEGLDSGELGIRLLSIDRATHKNALSVAMYRDLTQAINAFTADDDAKVLVFKGCEGIFCSGNDLADFMAASADNLLDESSPIWAFMVALRDCPKPVIVAVEGPAIGIGATLLLHVDAVFASPDAVFSFPFAKLGLCPEYASALLLPQRVGDLRAREWLMTGRKILADEALGAGLLNAVVENPAAAAMSYAERLAMMPPAALRMTKSLINSAQVNAVDDMMRREAKAFASALASPEFAEAVNAFFTRK